MLREGQPMRYVSRDEPRLGIGSDHDPPDM
jgi:hypothetical protein